MSRREEIDALFVYQRENFSVVGWGGVGEGLRLESDDG